MEADRDELARFFAMVLPHLNEVQRRVVAGAMAAGLGRGGKSAVAEASGMSRNTVIKAVGEVEAGIEPSTRLRAVGGGDIRAEDKQPGLLVALDELVNPDTRGNPMSFLRWTSKSMAKLADGPGPARGSRSPTTPWVGSNGNRLRLWKVELARLATETGLEITVAHYPPGTSKWNRIEHKMWSFVSMNWRGRPLVSYRTIIELISATTTTTGLTIRGEQDLNIYQTGTKITDAELAAIPLNRHDFHGDGNYTITQTNSR